MYEHWEYIYTIRRLNWFQFINTVFIGHTYVYKHSAYKIYGGHNREVAFINKACVYSAESSIRWLDACSTSHLAGSFTQNDSHGP